MDEAESKQCPYCAELIRLEALKCRYCGEFLDDDDEDEDEDELAENYEIESDDLEPVWEWGTLGWKCLAHSSGPCVPCTQVVKPPIRLGGYKNGTLFPNTSGQPFRPTSRVISGDGYEGRRRHREKLSVVGAQTESGLSCPRCGSTDFTAKRSARGKMLAGVLAPKTRVKCVPCGLMFKRG